MNGASIWDIENGAIGERKMNFLEYANVVENKIDATRRQIPGQNRIGDIHSDAFQGTVLTNVRKKLA